MHLNNPFITLYNDSVIVDEAFFSSELLAVYGTMIIELF